jgi:hypothetical protein
MPNTNAPRGFRHVGSLGSGLAVAGQMTQYRIASGYAANIFANDVVKFLSTGYINRVAAGEQFRGVLVSVSWVGSDGVPRQQPWWPASTVTLNAQDAYALVIDDPNAIFEARIGNASTGAQRSDVGALFDIFDSNNPTATTFSLATGQSQQGIDITTLATTLKQFRLLDYVQRPDNDLSSGNAAYAVGRFTPVNHDFRVQTGI